MKKFEIHDLFLFIPFVATLLGENVTWDMWGYGMLIIIYANIKYKK